MNKEILAELAAHNHNIVGELLMVKVSRVRAEIGKSAQETIWILWGLILYWQHVLYSVLYISYGNLWHAVNSFKQLFKSIFTLFKLCPPCDCRFVENEFIVYLYRASLQVHSYVKWRFAVTIRNPLTVWRSTALPLCSSNFEEQSQREKKRARGKKRKANLSEAGVFFLVA